MARHLRSVGRLARMAWVQTPSELSVAVRSMPAVVSVSSGDETIVVWAFGVVGSHAGIKQNNVRLVLGYGDFYSSGMALDCCLVYGTQRSAHVVD